MIARSLAELAAVCGGQVHGCEEPESLMITADIVTDSREATPGSLYVARVGEQADGHRFVGGAQERGAVAALTSRPVSELPCVVVDDVQEAFASITSSLIASRPDLRVIGITGSSGKTSTKDLLASVLATHAATVATVGSLNSEVGVPLTVTRITTETANLVLEMGARGIGHIRYLTTMTRPSIGVVLNVGSAHVGEFGGREGIAIAKAELVEALPATGLAVLNADDPLVAAMRHRTQARVVLAGRGEDAEVRATDVHVNLGQASFTLVTPVGQAPVELKLLGEHHVGNALAVAAVALECGMTPAAIASALSVAEPASRFRMERTVRPDGVTVINDAYNANPESMAAAIAALAQIAPTGRAWMAVGEMLELGEHSAAEHEKVGQLLAHTGITHVVSVGGGTIPVAQGYSAASGPGAVVHCETKEDALEYLEPRLQSGDVILVKSSKSVELSWLGQQLATREDAR